MGGDETCGSTDGDEALLHDVRLTVKGNNEKIRKRSQVSVIVDAESVEMATL